MKRNLLHTPEGVRDIYNGECAQKLHIQDCIHNVINKYGYSDIQTPSFEFFDIFNKERGSVASNYMFKLFDREGNTLVLRPDMTPSIARCAAKYFENDLDPIRLCYAGNTFVNNSRYQGRLKEVTQVGCELINDNSITADVEMVATLVESILSTGLTEFQVEIGHVGFFKGLVEEAGLDEESAFELRQVIRDKNIFRVGELIEEGNDSFYMLPQLFGGVEILDKAKTITHNETALNAIKHLEEVFELLKVYGFDKYVTVDLGMLSELDYYTGIIFQGYTYDVGEPIAGGGRYDKLIGQFGNDKASIGFCITIDILHQALKRQGIEIETGSKAKLLVCSADMRENGIRLASYFRNKGVKAVLVTNTPNKTEAYDEVIEVTGEVLERYGI